MGRLDVNEVTQQIKRFLFNHWSKDPKMGHDKDPLPLAFMMLLKNLSGIDVRKKPKQPAAWEIWKNDKAEGSELTNFEKIVRPLVKKAMTGRKEKDRGGITSGVIKAQMKLLSTEERSRYDAKAKKIGDEKKKEWEEASLRKPDLSPHQVQL